MSHVLIETVSKAVHLGGEPSNQLTYKSTIYDLLGEALLSNNYEYDFF
jgi:hypothetical protein